MNLKTGLRMDGKTHAALAEQTVRRWQQELGDGRGRTVGAKGLWL